VAEYLGPHLTALQSNVNYIFQHTEAETKAHKPYLPRTNQQRDRYTFQINKKI
jgi:hypothetical protein